MNKRAFELLVPVLVLAVLAALNLFVPGFQSIERRVYDMFLHIKPDVAERQEILFVDVDDTAIEQVGQWPWSRDRMTEGLYVLSEFNSGPVTFDIEYLEQSPLAVDIGFLSDELPELFDLQFDKVRQGIIDLFTALSQGQITLADAEDFVSDLVFLTDDARATLLDAAADIAQDNDALLGHAAAFHGSVYFTVNLPTPDELISGSTGNYDPIFAQSFAARDGVQIGSSTAISREAVDLWPAITPILSGGAGAGFPNVVVDGDGVRRRIDLFGRYEGDIYGQLVTAPLLDWLGNPEVTITESEVILRSATLPGETRSVDITIPLTEDGRMLLNWPKTSFINSFRHITFYRLIDHTIKEETLVTYLRAMDEAGLFFFVDGSENLLPLYDFAEGLRQDVLKGGSRSQIADWRDYRAQFYDLAGAVLTPATEAAYVGAIDDAIASGELTEDLVADYQLAREDAATYFGLARELHGLLTENRAVLAQEVPGSFIVIGWTGTSTTDIGVNPFIERYVNVGTHGALVNTILEQDFLDDMPWWIPFAIGGAVALIVTLLIHNLGVGAQILIGLGGVLVMFGAGLGYFLFTGVYPNVITPVGTMLLTFVVLTIANFIVARRALSRVNSLFGKYISPAVRDKLIDDPESQSMGGRTKELTAFFTDVQGFSTISEKLNEQHGESGAQALGELLNRYLTAMTDKIQEEDATIDKYEGDAIIAFFGAPVDLDDCPGRACRAAIRMKKLEEELNRQLLADGVTPAPLLTRIGINTGPISVGNFGTEERRDYTIMGHHVNLAARLEGVNKQYGTWILVSENTYGKLNPRDQDRQFSWRRLDRVRAVGMSEPVRLYELVDFREEVDKDPHLIDMLKCFNKGLNLFEDKKWEEAGNHFKQCLEAYPNDGPAKTYLKRCTDPRFLREAQKPGWDGVFNLTQK